MHLFVLLFPLFIIYDFLFTVLFIVVIPLMIKKYGLRRTLSEVFSKFYFLGFLFDKSRYKVLVHCSSIGEVKTLAIIFETIKDIYGIYPLITIFTKSGFEALRFSELQKKSKLVVSPFPTFTATLLFLVKVKPKYVIFMESDLWPPYVLSAKLIGAKVIVINGRISKKSFNFYKSFGRFIFKSIDIMCAQNSVYKERFEILGAKTIFVTGNIKNDREFVKPHNNRKYIVFVSSRESIKKYISEEEFFCRAVKKVDRKAPFSFILAPRHKERLKVAERILKYYNLNFLRYSEINLEDINTSPDNVFILLDKKGVLDIIYPYCKIAIVGGTFVPIGGHNIVEPLFFNIPVIFGQFTEKVNYEAEVLVESGVGFRALTPDMLVNHIYYINDNMEEICSKIPSSIEKLRGAKRNTKSVLEKFKNE